MVSYKEEHQRFMTGNTGTSLDAVIWLISAACVSTVLREAIIMWTSVVIPLHHYHRFIVDFVILILPSLMMMTVLSDNLFSLLISYSILAFALFYIYIRKCRPSSLSSAHLHNINLDQRKTFITYFRSIVNLLTALAILAVDFQVFPRKFAKTEEFGYGLMDFGVGFFVISNAIVSPEARGKENPLPILSQIKKAIVSSLPLLVLGFARLISIKGTDYHEHVTEYGVHWNFFFTLAALKVLSTLLFCYIPNIKPGIIGVLLLIFHQLCMSNGLSAYIIFGSDGKKGRTSLIDANREGIFSLPGYIALYMLGVQLGRFLFVKRSSLWAWLRTAVYLGVASIVMLFLNHALHSNVQMVSRRFVNAAYVLCTMIFSCIALTICLIGDIAKTYSISIRQTSAQQETICSKSFHLSNMDKSKSEDFSNIKNHQTVEEAKRNKNVKELCILEAIGFNSLLFFLLANLMTGFVNMSMSTIYADTTTALTVLSTYSFVLCLTFVILYLKDIKSKFW